MNYSLEYLFGGDVGWQWKRVGLLSFLFITLSLTHCANHVAPSHSNKAAGGNGRSYKDEVAVNRRRAAYWRERGYVFDYRDTTASQMDLFASVWTPSGWSEFKAMAEQTLSNNARRNAAQKHAETADAALAVPEKTSPTSRPTPIVPRAKPLPMIGP